MQVLRDTILIGLSGNFSEDYNEICRWWLRVNILFGIADVGV